MHSSAVYEYAYNRICRLERLVELVKGRHVVVPEMIHTLFVVVYFHPCYYWSIQYSPPHKVVNL